MRRPPQLLGIIFCRPHSRRELRNSALLVQWQTSHWHSLKIIRSLWTKQIYLINSLSSFWSSLRTEKEVGLNSDRDPFGIKSIDGIQ